MNEYSKTYEIRWSDIDANGHVNYAAYIDAAGDLRYHFFTEHEFPPERFENLGIGPIYTAIHARFFREVRMGETVTITYSLSGLPRSERKILAYVASLGRSAHDVKRILLTHSDLDHVGGLAALHKLTGACTYASRIEADAIAAGKSSRQINISGFSVRRLMFTHLRPFMKAAIFQVDEILIDGQILPVLGGLQVIDTSGHTPGHISLFAPAVHVLFCGDSLVTDENGIHGSRPGLTWDDAKAREAERKQAALGAHIVCSGHGPVVMDATGRFPL